METKNIKEKSDVPALEASIKILEYLSRYEHRASTLSKISKDLSLNKSTCHRILKLLQSHHFVSFDEVTKQYCLGSYLVVLGSVASEFIDYLRLARPHLKWLCEQTKQTAVLLEPISNNQLMYVAKEEPDLPVRVTVNIGQHFPLTSASFGKCFLAFMDETKADEIIRKVGLRKFTDTTITNISQYKETLKQVRIKGYAESYAEYTPGICGAAAPIFDVNGNVNMIIACIGLETQMNQEVISFCGAKLKEAANAITSILGGRKPDIM